MRFENEMMLSSTGEANERTLMFIGEPTNRITSSVKDFSRVASLVSCRIVSTFANASDRLVDQLLVRSQVERRWSVCALVVAATVSSGSCRGSLALGVIPHCPAPCLAVAAELIVLIRSGVSAI